MLDHNDNPSTIMGDKTNPESNTVNYWYYNNIETIIYYNNIKEARKGFMNEVFLDDPDIKDLYLFRKFKMNNKEELIKYGYKSNGNI